MPHSSGPAWYARELAQLQEEITRLYRLLEVLAPLSEPHEESPGHPAEPARGESDGYRTGDRENRESWAGTPAVSPSALFTRREISMRCGS